MKLVLLLLLLSSSYSIIPGQQVPPGTQTEFQQPKGRRRRAWEPGFPATPDKAPAKPAAAKPAFDWQKMLISHVFVVWVIGVCCAFFMPREPEKENYFDR
jgi:hypothetical protein